MRTKEIIATVAITGAVATFALLNINSVQNGNTFLATPMTDAERSFIQFVSEHRRSYGTKEEYEFRLQQFKTAYSNIQSENSKNDNTFTVGVNKFADLTNAEFKKMLGYRRAGLKANS